MQPNSPYQPEPTGIDYLNQIAPPPPSAGFDKKSKIILLLAGLIGLISLAMIATMAMNQSSAGPSPLALAARLQKLQAVSDNYGSRLRSIPLQDANSSLKTVLITANNSINEPLLAYSIDAKKQAKEIAALDPSTAIETKLDEAYLNSLLDVTYAREMTFQLEETLVMMERLERTTRIESMKQFLTKTIADFENLKKQFADASDG